MMEKFFKIILISCFLCAGIQAAEENNLVLGKIEFDTSASGLAQEKFVQGVMALHSFWYEQARKLFVEAQQIDPAFGMAYWGEAMSFDNALGTVMDTDYESRGEAAVIRMVNLDEEGMLRWNERERNWFDAIKERFSPGQAAFEKRRNYGRVLERMSEQYPEDDEIQIFATLALMSFPGFDKEQAAHVVLAAATLEEIYQRNPDHPGALHYLIHVYDSTTFARMGMRQAIRYGGIAASAPHAVHMPSHIYKHLGMLDEMLLSNITSWLISKEWQKKSGRPIHMRDFHTFNWLLDTHILMGEQEQARQLMAELDAMEKMIADQNQSPGHFPETAAMLRQKFNDNITQP